MFYLAKYGVAWNLDGFKLLDSTTKNFRANPTLAAGDAKITKDGGAEANLATLPAALPAASVHLRVALSAAEMQCKIATVSFIDAAGAEWDDNALQVFTFGDPSAFFPFDFSVPTVSIPSAQVTQIAATVFDSADAIETGLTMRGAIRLIASICAGLLDVDGNTHTFRNAVANTKDRVIATTDSSNSRTVITTDLT